MDKWCYMLTERYEGETAVHQIYGERADAIDAARELTADVMQTLGNPEGTWDVVEDHGCDSEGSMYRTIYRATDGDPHNHSEVCVVQRVILASRLGISPAS